MTCPVCSMQCGDDQICSQCGSDLKVHQMINELRVKGPAMTTTVSQPTIERTGDGRTSYTMAKQFPWIWVILPSQVSIIALVVALVIVARPTKSQDPVIELKLSDSVTGNIEQVRTFTLILKDMLGLMAEQQKELTDLRNNANQNSLFQAKRKSPIKNQE